MPTASPDPKYQAASREWRMNVKLKDIDLHLVEIIHHNIDNRCYNTTLPCICQENPYLQPRGDSIRNGFRMTPYPDSAFIQNYKY